MRRTIPILLAWALLTALSWAKATAEDAYIIPEQLQILAAEQNVAARLGIKWEAANSTDVGHYMGTLAAADIVAKKIAGENDRKVPTRADYLSGLASICLWPPQKPPIFTSEDRQRFYAAFYNNKLKESLPGAVGKAAVQLPSLIAGKSQSAANDAVNLALPKDRSQYFDSVFNLNALR